MKNNIKYLLLAFLAITIYSCEEDNSSLDYYDLEANVILADNKISVFDQSVDLEINLLTQEGILVNSIEVFKDGTKITDATIDGTSASFNSSNLTPFLFENSETEELTDLTGSFDVSLYSTLSNGKFINQSSPVTVVSAITNKEELAYVKYLDTTSQIISFKTFTAHATVDEVMVQWKKNKTGTYVEDTTKTLSTEENTINLGDLDYINNYGLAKNDTLYYKFIAKSGLLTDEVTTSIAINTQAMNASSMVDLTSSTMNMMNVFNFDTKMREDAEIEYQNYGFEVSIDANIEFVKITPTNVEDHFTAGDLFDAEDDFNSGTSQTSFSNVSADDLYVFKTTRTADDETITYFGLLLINDVTTVTNDSSKEITIEFEFKEGTIIRE